MASMFEYPEAKRVRRSELVGSEHSSADGSVNGDGGYDEELRAALEARIAKSLGLADPSDIPQRRAATEPSHDMRNDSDASNDHGDALAEPTADEAAADDDEGYTFRLFSTSDPVSKVVLEDENEELKGDGGLVRGRPLSYYWVANVPAQQKREYEFAAVSGDEVLARSTRPSYGLAMPWKVRSLTITKRLKGGKEEVIAHSEDPSLTKKRKRPGKKRRIAVRTKERARKAKEEAAAKQTMEKEEHLKEKKKRLNRLKKLRKRAKAKEKKSGAGEGGGGDEGDSGGDTSGSE